MILLAESQPYLLRTSFFGRLSKWSACRIERIAAGLLTSGFLSTALPSPRILCASSRVALKVS